MKKYLLFALLITGLFAVSAKNVTASSELIVKPEKSTENVTSVLLGDSSSEINKTNLKIDSNGPILGDAYSPSLWKIENGNSLVPLVATWGVGTSLHPLAFGYFSTFFISSIANSSLSVTDGTTTSTMTTGTLQVGKTSGFNSGKFAVDSSGNVSASGTILGSNGTASAPTFGFIADPNTGIYRYSEGTMALSSNGTVVAYINATAFQINEQLWPVLTDVTNIGSASYAFNNIFANGTLTDSSSTLFATTTLNYQSFALGNNSFSSSANGTTTIGSLQTTNLNFPDDAGEVGWVDLPITTTTASIPMSYTASINSFGYMKMWGETTTAGALNRKTARVSFFPDNGVDEFTNHGGTKNYNGQVFSASSTITTGQGGQSIFDMDMASATSTIGITCNITGKMDGANQTANYLVHSVGYNYQGGTIAGTWDTFLSSVETSSTWKASSTYSGTVFSVNVYGETAQTIFWTANCNQGQITY